MLQTRTIKASGEYALGPCARGKLLRAVQELNDLVTFAADCLQQAQLRGPLPLTTIEELRANIHSVFFYDKISRRSLEDSGILTNEDLTKIMDNIDGIFPIDISLDAKELYLKWSHGDYDAHPMRGLELKEHTSESGRTFKAYSLTKGYQFKVSADYVGHGRLIIGQWWPLRVCAIRDGAHGESEAGIYGKIGSVAYSIVVSSQGYANVDSGDTIQYCGNSGNDKIATARTKMLLECVRKSSAVRVLRSASRTASPYLPKKGLRYDGLYDVLCSQLLDKDTAMYRFTLSRQPGQPPIRNTGAGSRPNEKELGKYQQLRKEYGLAYSAFPH